MIQKRFGDNRKKELLGAPATLSRRATEQLEALSAQSPTDPECTILHYTKKGCEWWTYAGLKANAALIQRFALPATFDSLTIRARCSAIELKQALDATPRNLLPEIDLVSARSSPSA
jgi:hypothetical protein